MERMLGGLGQIVLGFIKILVLFFLPVVSFVVPLVGIPIPGVALRGFRMFNTGNMLILLPILIYLGMILLSIGPLQKYSVIAAVVALIVEIVFLFIAKSILTSGDIAYLIELIPADFRTYIEIGLNKMAVSGYGIYINIGLTILYIVWYWVSDKLFGGSRPTGGGFNGGARARSSVNRPASQPTGGINRPRI